MSSAKDLTQEAPRSPRIRLKNYVILARTTDKCRAFLAGKIGDYHFDCPLDNILFGFKGINGDDFKAEIQDGATDEAIANWVDSHGTAKTPEEVKAWSDQMETVSLYNDPEKGEYFSAECRKLNLDPAKTTLFEWLEADDKASYAK